MDINYFNIYIQIALNKVYTEMNFLIHTKDHLMAYNTHPPPLCDWLSYFVLPPPKEFLQNTYVIFSKTIFLEIWDKIQVTFDILK